MEGKKEKTLINDYEWYTALNRAIKKNRRDSHNRYLQLATIRHDGSPAVRTLVFRKLQQDPALIMMVTDSRSEKPDQIAANSAAEICWYFTKTREQFRFRGTILIISEESSDQSLRQILWSSLSTTAQEQFYWAHPGKPMSILQYNRDTPHSALNENRPQGSLPPDNFLLLCFQINRIDHLSLKGEPQSRWITEHDGSANWISKPVNP